MSDLFSWFVDQYAELVAAVRFLSILPLPGPAQHFETSIDNSSSAYLKLGSGYFSLVGLLLGTLLSLLLWLLEPHLPQLVIAALLVVALVLLTGGLHLDGLMDSCDGIFGGRTTERKLEIMRDSRVGSFGVLGGACALLLKFAFFASLSQHALSIALLVILPSARWAMVLALRTFPSARPTGLGVLFRQSVTLPRLLFAGIVAFSIASIFGHLQGILLLGMATLIALALGAWITRNIGGLTGDSYGAIAEIAELGTLLLLLFFHTWL